MAKYRIVYDREACIGAGACVGMAPKDWEMNADAKADLLGGKKREDGMWVKIIDEAEFKTSQEAADACPVAIIKLEKIEDEEDE
jgi:ferredoxin